MTLTAEEHSPFKALLEDLETRISAIGEGHAANSERIDATKTELEQQIKEVDDRLIVVDVKLMQRIDALDTGVHEHLHALDRKTDDLDRRTAALDQRIDALETKLSTELSRITMRLGINEAPFPDSL